MLIEISINKVQSYIKEVIHERKTLANIGSFVKIQHLCTHELD